MEASGSKPPSDKISTACLLFAPSFAERLYQGDISNWKLLAGKEKRKTTLDQWRVKIMTTLIWPLFKRGFCHVLRTFLPCDNTVQWFQALDPTTVPCFNTPLQKLDSLRALDFWRGGLKVRERSIIIWLFWLRSSICPPSSVSKRLSDQDTFISYPFGRTIW